jgi:hypothetical protein
MTDNNISQLHVLEPIDLLRKVLKQGVKDLPAKAIETEVQEILDATSHE